MARPFPDDNSRRVRARCPGNAECSRVHREPASAGQSAPTDELQRTRRHAAPVPVRANKTAVHQRRGFDSDETLRPLLLIGDYSRLHREDIHQLRSRTFAEMKRARARTTLPSVAKTG